MSGWIRDDWQQLIPVRLVLESIPTSVTSYLLGSLIIIAAFPGWVGNLLVLITIITRGFLKNTAPVIYKLIGSLAVSDFGLLTLHVFYLGPSSCLQSWLLPEKWTALPGDLFDFCWYNMWFMFIAIAVNRYVAICRFSSYNTTFTHKRTNYCVIISGIVAPLFWTHFLWMPSCRFYMTFITYSYMLEPNCNGIDYMSHMIIEVGGSAGVTLIMTICCTFILMKMRKSRLQVASHSSNQRQPKQDDQQKAKEARLAIQFLAIAVVYTAVWGLFHIITFLGVKTLEFYVIIALLGIANSSINPLIYLVYNEALTSELLAVFRKSTATVTTIARSKPQGIGQRFGSKRLTSAVPNNNNTAGVITDETHGKHGKHPGE